MSSNTRASVKNKANNDPTDELKRRARRRLVGSLALFLTALIVVPALIEGEPSSTKPEIELVFPSKPGNQEVAVESSNSVKESVQESRQDSVKAPADSNPDIIPPPTKTPIEKVAPKVEEVPSSPTEPMSSSMTTAEPKKPTVQDIAKAAAAKEASNKEASNKEAAKDAAMKEAAAKEAAKLASKAEQAKRETAAKEAAKPKPVEKPEDAIAKFADTDAKPISKPEIQSASKPTYIQVAALKDQARAEALKEELSAKGFASRIQSLVTDQGTVYRVRIGPFADAEKADKTKSDLSKQGYNARVAQ